MLFGATSVWAAVGDVFTANVKVIEDDGTTKYIPMRFKVQDPVWWVFDTGSIEVSSCVVSCVTDELSGARLPAMNKYQKGKVIIPQTVMGPDDGVTPYYTVTGIGDYAFEGCSFSEIELPERSDYIHSKVFEIGQDAFNKSAIKDLYIPDNYRISSTIVRECTSLSSISVSDLYNGTLYVSFFSGCSSLKSVEFRSIVRIIQSYAFRDCNSLKSISIPEGLEKIESKAFYDCDYLERVCLPSTLKTIEQDVFTGCVRLGDVILKSETPPTIVGFHRIINGWADYTPTRVLYVPDKAKYKASEDWTFSFGENIKSFLPTVEQTVNTWFNYSVGLTWPLSYTENYSASDVLDLVIDGKPTVPQVWEGYNELIVSKDPKHIPQEVSFLLMTSEGLVPYKLHYNVHNFGFSINGKEMTSLDMYNIPGLVSGDAYIAVPINAPDYPTLVLDNATLEWDTNAYGLSNHDLYQDGLTIKVIGDCTIKVPNTIALGLDVATVTTIEGGGTLNIISGSYPIETAIVTWLRIQDNTTVIARNITGNSALWDQDGAKIEIRDGGVFAAYSKYEPIWLDSNGEFIFGEGIALRYPVGAYVGSGNNIYNADGTKVENDWVVIGPDTQATHDLIDGVDEIDNSQQTTGNGFIYNMAGQKVGDGYKGIVIKDGKKIMRK
ncbi:MAG: leucine-rich repeat domain-containing protein [Bacteroidaceae bacterium]|nr:leucine-rich repeat domain-containing protein [Bacteroidaceae bacterium]